METPILFYKLYLGKAQSSEFVHWAISMLEKGHTSYSLKILSSLREPLNIFEVDDYFRRTLDELQLPEPSFEECADFYIKDLSKKILENNDDILDLAYEIFKVASSLGYPEELQEWIHISDMIDDFRYGDNYKNIDQKELIVTIRKEAEECITILEKSEVNNDTGN